MRLLATAVIAALISTGAASQDNARRIREIYNNLAYEAVECASYYMILSAGLTVSGAEDSAMKASKLSEAMLDWADALASRAGLMPETVKARLDNATREQRRKIADNAANIAVLRSEFEEKCRTAVQNPEARVDHWLRQVK